MVSLREFIPEHKKLPIEQAFAKLREEINFEEALNQINLALYIFQDAVSMTKSLLMWVSQLKGKQKYLVSKV